MFATVLAVLVSFNYSVFGLNSTPELSLLVVNLIFFLIFINNKEKFVLKIKEIKKQESGIWDFVLEGKNKINFKAGQFSEFVIPHENSDNKGDKRWFSVIKERGENTVSFGTRFPEKPSSLKRKLLKMKVGDEIVMNSPEGNFTLQNLKNKNVILISQGVGITPFISMLKDLKFSENKNNLNVFLYNLNYEGAFPYENFLKSFEMEKFEYKNIELKNKESWKKDSWVKIGLDEKTLQENNKDYKNSVFYISGAPNTVNYYKQFLKKAGIKSKNIKTDFFFGY